MQAAESVSESAQAAIRDGTKISPLSTPPHSVLERWEPHNRWACGKAHLTEILKENDRPGRQGGLGFPIPGVKVTASVRSLRAS